ncbi:MAG TPA: hypothetical protein VF598_01950 [Hymenobacter sp.]|jgi:hypothetical protein
MSKRPLLKRYNVKRTRLGVRFSLNPREQYSLKLMVEQTASTSPVTDLNDYGRLMAEMSRKQAQEWLTRRSFLLMPLSQEHRFTMSLADAFALLVMTWNEPGLELNGNLHRLFLDLHQVLTTTI